MEEEECLPFAVWRLDDNGNRFMVLRGLSREEAERLAASFEAKGHKQSYWIAPEEGALPP